MAALRGGSPLAQAGCTAQQRASRHRSLRHQLLCGRPAQGSVLFWLPNPRRGLWTSPRGLFTALCASEDAIWWQPCEGVRLAQAGCTAQQRASRHRSLRHQLLCRRPAQGSVLFRLPNPRRGLGTSPCGLFTALCASEDAIWWQPCEGVPLAQAGCTAQQRASRHRSLRHQLLCRRPAQGSVLFWLPCQGRIRRWSRCYWCCSAVRSGPGGR